MTYYIKNPLKSKALTSIACGVCGIMILSNCEKLMPENSKGIDTSSNISELPSFHKVEISLPEITDETRSALANISDLVSSRDLYAKEVLSDADRLGIPYSNGIQHTDHWTKFVDEVYNYQTLLEEAHSHNIDWNLSEYDPQALATLIEEAENDVWKAEKSAMRDYYSSLGAEV
jgi:hypothetical protein